MSFKQMIELKLQALEAQKRRYEKKLKQFHGYKLYAKHTRGTVRYCYRTAESTEQKYIGWLKNGAMLRQLLERENAAIKLHQTERNLSALQVLLGAYDFSEENPMEETGMLRGENAGGKPHYPPSESSFKRDVFFTMDGPNGEIDLNAVDELLQMLSLLS